jgi:hypothetical protein
LGSCCCCSCIHLPSHGGSLLSLLCGMCPICHQGSSKGLYRLRCGLIAALRSDPDVCDTLQHRVLHQPEYRSAQRYTWLSLASCPTALTSTTSMHAQHGCLCALSNVCHAGQLYPQHNWSSIVLSAQLCPTGAYIQLQDLHRSFFALPTSAGMLFLAWCLGYTLKDQGIVLPSAQVCYLHELHNRRA